MATNEALEIKALKTGDSYDIQENTDHDSLWKDFIERFLSHGTGALRRGRYNKESTFTRIRV